MDIRDIIDQKLVVTDLSVQTKDEVFRELSRVLANQGYVSDEEHFVRDIYEREAEGQTGIGNYIAIPHSKSASVSKIGVVIAVNDREIPWESLDGKGVRVIILFAVSDDVEGAQEHLKLLALFARKLGNDTVVDRLLKAKTVDDVTAAFA